MAGVLDAKSVAGTATEDMGFGIVADAAAVVACLVAFAGFLEAKSITATGDVACGVVAAAAGEGVAVVIACLVAFAGFSSREVGTGIVGGGKDAIWGVISLTCGFCSKT